MIAVRVSRTTGIRTGRTGRVFHLIDEAEDPALFDYADELFTATENEFGRQGPELVELAWGEIPETLPPHHLVNTAVPVIALCRIGPLSPRWYAQLAHEALHLVIPVNEQPYPWEIDLLAEMWKVKWLDRSSNQDLKSWATTEVDYAVQVACTFEDALEAPYPPGPPFYGAMITTGQALERAIGWDRIREIANHLDGGGRPDFERWFNQLSEPEQTAVKTVLRPALS